MSLWCFECLVVECCSYCCCVLVVLVLYILLYFYTNVQFFFCVFGAVLVSDVTLLLLI